MTFEVSALFERPEAHVPLAHRDLVFRFGVRRFWFQVSGSRFQGFRVLGSAFHPPALSKKTGFRLRLGFRVAGSVFRF